MKKKVFLSLLITGVLIAATIGVVLAKPWTGISTTPTSNAIIGGNALGYTQPAYYAVAKSGIELSNGHTIPSGARFVIYKTATTNRYAALYGTESLSYFTSSSVTSDSRFQITSEYTDGGRRLTDGVVPNEYMIALAKMNAQSIAQCKKVDNYEEGVKYINFVFCATLGENGPLLTYNEETKTGNWTSSDLPYVHGDCIGYAFDNSGNPIYCLDNGIMRKGSNGTTVSGSYDIWPDNLKFTKTAGTVYVDNGDGTGYFYAMSCASLASTSIKQRYRTIGFTISLDVYPKAAETEEAKAALTWDGASNLYTQLGLSDSAIIYEIPFTDTDGDKHRTDNPSITIFSVSLDDVITAVYANSEVFNNKNLPTWNT